MKNLFGVNKKIFVVYLLVLIISIMLICVYFIACDEKIGVLSCSIGSSLFGAVILAYFIDLINQKLNLQKLNNIKNKLFKLLIYCLQKYLFDTEKLINQICEIKKIDNFNFDDYEQLRTFTNELITREKDDNDEIDNLLLKLLNHKDNFNFIFDALYQDITLLMAFNIIDDELLDDLNHVSSYFKMDLQLENYLLIRNDIKSLLKNLTKDNNNEI